ncbi:hypothetical protein [Pseudomonas sp. PAB10]|uniref:hypothetical protein n=1 Tax=Pseudomonas sp. PAB10 TaxID=3233047 RepID=UPI003F9D75B7
MQTFNNVESNASEPRTFAVKPPKPAIEPPPNPAEPDQILTITGVYSDSVTLEMFTETNVEVPGTFSDTGTTRTFTPDADWTPGSNTVKVVQFFNDVASNPSDECTFTVESGEKPDVPKFELPYVGSQTPTRPTIRINGLPHALITVRLKDAEELCSEIADANGELEFKVNPPLVPGRNDLEAKQKVGGPWSEWSGPRQFTVKELPKTPVITGPTNGGSTSRKLRIKGEGKETRGQILLRHDGDAEDKPFAETSGVKSWRWDAQELWPIGNYTILAQHEDDGDSSPWTEPHTFEVVDSLYGIGDAGPVLGQPVESTGQSVLLRVQVVLGDTREAVEGVTLEWRIQGEQDVIATTVTGPNGWTQYRYTPGSVGKHKILADITRDNQGVVMTELFEVTALSHDDWAQEAELYLNGTRVDLANGDLVLLRGKPYELELNVNSDSVLIGSSVTLQDLWGAAERGLKFVPDLGAPQPIAEGKPVRWSVSADGGEGGFFGLKLTNPALPDWQLPGRVISESLADEVIKIEVRERPISDVGAVFFSEEPAPLKLTFEPWMEGLTVWLDEVGSPDLGLTYFPDLKQPRTVPDNLILNWDVTSSIGTGRFSLQVVCPDTANPLEIPCRLLQSEFAKEIAAIEVGGRDAIPYPMSLDGMGILLRKGWNDLQFSITLFLKPDSLLTGLKYKLVWLEGDLGVPPKQSIPSLDLEKVIGEDNNITFSWKNFRDTKEGRFKLAFQYEGCEAVIPGVVVEENSSYAVLGAHFNNIYYPKPFSQFKYITYDRDGIKRTLRVTLSASPLADLIVSGFIKPKVWIPSMFAGHNVLLAPKSGTELKVDPSSSEMHFDMWADPGNYGGNYEVHIIFPFNIAPVIIYCLVKPYG